MGLSVTFVSGVRRSGKSALIRTMIDRLWSSQPHYIRLVRAGGDKRPPKTRPPSSSDCGVATASWLEYDPERSFEALPDALTTIHRRDRFGCVVIEADADAALRHAYPYDHRVFVMPMPSGVNEVFRDPSRAAVELQKVLDDTAAFASEIFGLFANDGKEDADPPEERHTLTATQMRGFLRSPLGDELATRIQLKQSYHGLVESDVVVVNAGVGDRGPDTDECVRRVKRLLIRAQGAKQRAGELFVCNPCDQNGSMSRALLDRLKPMCLGGT